MKNIFIGIKVASFIQMVEGSTQVLLENIKTVDLIFKKGFFYLLQSYFKIYILVKQNFKYDFLIDKLDVNSGNFKCYNKNDHMAFITRGSHN